MRKTSLTLLIAVMAMALGAAAMVWADAAPTTAPAADVGSDDNPVNISQLPDAITVDGDPAKWDKIKAIPAPFAKKDEGSVKLAWREDGLYGLLQVKDDKITADDTNPWSQDALELWLETDDAKAESMSDNSDQIALAPNPTAGPGKATVVVIGAINPDAIKAMWKTTDGGYALEFFIPVKELTPAKFVEGTKVGLHYSVDDKGKSIEQFFTDKDTDMGYKTPKSWGTIELAK
jgi:hypothetical protein